MSVDFNSVSVMGRFGQKPELKTTQNGKSYVFFSIACNNDYGENKQTDWIDCRAWGKTAELIAEWFDKGSRILVEGRLGTSDYEDKDGVRKKATYITVLSFHFVDPRNTDQNASQGQQKQQYINRPQYNNQQASQNRQYPSYVEFDDSEF